MCICPDSWLAPPCPSTLCISLATCCGGGGGISCGGMCCFCSVSVAFQEHLLVHCVIQNTGLGGPSLILSSRALLYREKAMSHSHHEISERVKTRNTKFEMDTYVQTWKTEAFYILLHRSDGQKHCGAVQRTPKRSTIRSGGEITPGGRTGHMIQLFQSPLGGFENNSNNFGDPAAATVGRRSNQQLPQEQWPVLHCLLYTEPCTLMALYKL